MNLADFDIGILGPAFIAGLLVLATHVPLGQQVLSRGIIFIDLAIAQVASLGVIAAHQFADDLGPVVIQVSAVSAALLSAMLLNYTEKRWPEIQEALIGVLFVLAACAGILLLANDPHGGEHLKDLLVGQILWITYEQLIPMAVLTAAITVLWFTGGSRSGRIGFYAIFAVAVTASVQLVGVYLVFASLIIPALASRYLSPRVRLVAGYAVGIFGYVLGLTLSAVLDLPTGPVIVWTLVLAAFAGATLAPAKGKR